MLIAGLVLAVMILPIITAVSREVFRQTPKLHEEAALALGATRWEMIRMAVLPFGRSGVISGAMLGLGRALGETMAVAIVLSVSGVVTFNLISSTNPSTIAANIALQFPESSGLAVNVLIASGLVLFVITLLVNAARPLHHQPPPRVLGSQLMSTGTEPETQQQREAEERELEATLPSVADAGARAPVVGALGDPRRHCRRGRGRAAPGRPRRRACGRRHGRRVRPGGVPDLAGGRGPAQGDGPAGDRAGHRARSSSR